MPVDDQNQAGDEQPSLAAPPESNDAPTDVPNGAPPDVSDDTSVSATPAAAPSVRRRRFLNARNAAIAVGGVAVLLLIVVLAVVFFYRSGRVDDIIKNQIIATFDQYNIRAEVEGFETQLGARTAEFRNLVLYDNTTGAKLGSIRRLVATIRVEDLFALNLRRNVDLEALEIEGLDVSVLFDEEGRTNFANITLPEPDPNRRILFSYSTAKINISDSIVRYNDQRYDLVGEARNVRLALEPEDPNQPEESRMNRLALNFSDSTLSYQGRPVEPIDVELRGRLNQTRAEIDSLIVRSPVTESRLSGVLDDWRNLRYRLNFESVVDLQATEEVLQTGTSVRGFGNLKGTVTGEGTRYNVEAAIASDAIAAEGVRLQGLGVQATANGDGAAYEANGRAVAEVLTAGDFRLNALQLAGQLRGTGTDFRWQGELRAAAARSGANSVAGLILSDVMAEKRDAQLVATVGRVSGQNITAGDARIGGVNASGVRVTTNLNQETTTARFSINNARTGNIVASGARIGGVTASGIAGVTNGDATNLTAQNVRVGRIDAAGARIGTLNIAGARLAIRGGRVEASANDTNVGTVAFNVSGQSGQIENVRVANPVFVLEPSGSYRASADLSLGGGALGTLALGAARSSVVATNNQIELRNFQANLANGSATGDAVIATTTRGASNINADFSNLDVGTFAAAFGGQVIPITAQATGSVNLRFPGTNVALASGRLEANLVGETGSDTNGRTPLTGRVAVNANRGAFTIEQANVQAGATTLNASGNFSLESDSNLNLTVRSTDAAELQRILASSGFVPQINDVLTPLGVQLAGNLNFDGTLRGRLTAPTIAGQVSLASLLINNRNLGSLSATVNATPSMLNVTDGRLIDADGEGGIEFAANVPLDSTANGININATIDRFSANNLIALLPESTRAQVGDLRSDISGRIDVSGLPGAARGSADVRLSPGVIAGQPFEEIAARATFNGSAVTLENLDARFQAGRLSANGDLNLVSRSFDLNLTGQNLRLDLLTALAGSGAGSLPNVAGTLDLTARATGADFFDPRTYDISFDAQGENIVINGRPAGVLNLTGRTVNQQLNVTFTTGILGAPQVVTANINLADENLPTTIETTLNGVDLTPLFAAFLPANSDLRVTGRATGTLRASGNLFAENAEGERVFNPLALRGAARFTELTFAVNDVQLAAEDPLLVQFTGDEIVFERTRFTGQGSNLVIGGTYALTAAGRQNLSVVGDLNLRILNGLSPNVFLAGIARADVRVTGTASDPRVFGTANLQNAGISALIGSQRLVASNVNGTVRLTQNQAQIDSLTGRLGGGRFTVTGGATLEGFQPTQFRLALQGENVTLPLPQNIRATADADLVFQGSTQAQVLSGIINLRRAEYTEDIDIADLINRRDEASIADGGTGDGSGTGIGSTLVLDLRVQGRDALVVRNNLADIVGSTDLNIGGTLDEPLISGRVSVTQGTIVFRNDRYEITRGIIELPAQRNADPLINVSAEAEIRGYRVIVSLSGELPRLQATVRSDPALPQSDVVALITTGDLANENTTLAQSGIGTATSLVTDQILNAPLQRATDRLFGLNRFEINPGAGLGANGATLQPRLTVGRRVNRNLIITYSTNLTAQQNQIIALEYRVSDRVSFVANYQQGSTTGLQSRNNAFNFELRFRKRF
ncbi:MAG: translocation/assembly module TamB domain-containing protein [Pyrinomonadaceae bacterium MAG19_C2-C3]|nr:translocation/assembly module TamB domain-containing protein [Pyrinomonadaceae bacterium MAG19_C2-C3]